jgi:LAO/AO transport system ATPase
VLFVTNNSSATVADQEAALSKVGIPAVGDVITSAMAGAHLLSAGERVLMCGGPGLAEAIAKVGAISVSHEDVEGGAQVDTVIVGFHRHFDYEIMRRASTAIRRGARLVGTNDDATYPTPNGPIPSGGSILGDKTRMQDLSVMKEVFIRPSAAGSTLGGVARKTRESIFLCETAGYDVILIETVGVGQSETMVHSMVDFFLLLMLAGAGDELQGIKRGIMEMADLLVIHKADGENRVKAERAMAEVKSAIRLFPTPPSGWLPEVQTLSSIEKIGFDSLFQKLDRFFNHSMNKGFFDFNRKEQSLAWMKDALGDSLFFWLENQSDFHEKWKLQEEKVLLQQKKSNY